MKLVEKILGRWAGLVLVLLVIGSITAATVIFVPRAVDMRAQTQSARMSSLEAQITMANRCSAAEPFQMVTLLVWLQRDKGYRWELYKADGTLVSLVVANTRDNWYYQVPQQVATWYNSPAKGLEIPNLNLYDVTSFQTHTSPYQVARDLGTDIIALRPALHYEIMNPYAGSPGSSAGHCSDVKPEYQLWFDKETGLELKTETYAKSGEVLHTQYVSKFIVNQAFDLSMFDFVPPPRITLVTSARESKAYYDSLPPRYLTLAKEAGFSFFIVRTPPSGFEMPQEPTFLRTPYRTVIMEYVSPADGRSFTLTETDLENAPVPFPQGDAIKFGRREGTYREEGGTRTINMGFNRTYLTLASTSLSKADMVEILHGMMRLRIEE